MALEFSSSLNATGPPEMSHQDSTGRQRSSSGDGDASKALHDQIEEHRSVHDNRGLLSRAVASLTGENTAIARLQDLEHKGQSEKPQKNAITEAIQSDKDSIAFQDQVCQYTAGVLKTAALFLPRSMGVPWQIAASGAVLCRRSVTLEPQGFDLRNAL